MFDVRMENGDIGIRQVLHYQQFGMNFIVSCAFKLNGFGMHDAIIFFDLAPSLTLVVCTHVILSSRKTVQFSLVQLSSSPQFTSFIANFNLRCLRVHCVLRAFCAHRFTKINSTRSHLHRQYCFPAFPFQYLLLLLLYCYCCCHQFEHIFHLLFESREIFMFVSDGRCVFFLFQQKELNSIT